MYRYSIVYLKHCNDSQGSYVSGEFLGAALDRPWANGAVGHPLPHAGQHLDQRHRALTKVRPGQRAPGMLKELS